MCNVCRIPSCEVIIAGPRDLCSKHYDLLAAADRKRLEDLRPDGRDVYQAVLGAMVGKIEERLRRRAVAGTMGRASGHPAGPTVA
jgi:hypothetical protein